MKKILVAEDNILNQRLLKATLKQYGFEITIVGNGKEAIDAFSNDNFDYILMDVMMPVMNGLEATESIRAIESAKGGSVFIIGLTGNVYDDDKDKCLKAGMNAYLTKPFEVEEFLKIVR
jgi:CheY-like chemotaxis protein